MPDNAAVIAALVVFVPAFLGLFAVLGTPVGAALVAVGAAVLAGLAGQAVSQRARRDRLARAVAEANSRVAALATQVSHPATRASLLHACDTVPRLLARTAEADPAALPMTLHKLSDYLGSVESVLRRYLEIQEYPSSYRDADRLLANSRRTLTGFESFANHAAEQIGEANLESFFRDLAHLELMNPPRLPPSEEL
ncbi:hypothetical protein [Nocardia carnea]|uniref:hypothetical protein n=1 Tax=Nocardia carnea TaxID=37328 RepID=UPI00245560D8|nr:hypothetical protein [Nocardia carnea]